MRESSNDLWRRVHGITRPRRPYMGDTEGRHLLGDAPRVHPHTIQRPGRIIATWPPEPEPSQPHAHAVWRGPSSPTLSTLVHAHDADGENETTDPWPKFRPFPVIHAAVNRDQLHQALEQLLEHITNPQPQEEQ